jgi:hypothetical protein
MSSKGAKGTNPLVPPWAEQGNTIEISGSDSVEIDNQDIQNQVAEVPTLQPSSNRFQGARRAFGDYAKSGGTTSDLRRSLKHYSRAVGGSAGATRRLASGITAGSGLLGLLSGDSITTAQGQLALGDLSGLSTDAAIDRISEHLSPNSADFDIVRSSINYALSEALEEYSDFDDVEITSELLGQVFTCYLTDLVFEHVVLDMGETWFHAESPNKQIQMENELRELTKIIVDTELDRVSKGDLSSIAKAKFAQVQIQAIQAVIYAWENY